MDIFARGRAGRSMKYDSPVKIFKLIVGALTAPTSLALMCRWRSRPQHQKQTSRHVCFVISGSTLLFNEKKVSVVIAVLYAVLQPILIAVQWPSMKGLVRSC
jgi:hypothetical protein